MVHLLWVSDRKLAAVSACVHPSYNHLFCAWCRKNAKQQITLKLGLLCFVEWNTCVFTVLFTFFFIINKMEEWLQVTHLIKY